MKWLAIAWLGMSLALGAQEPPTPKEIPPGPLLKRAPRFASWTITISRGKKSEPSPKGPDGSPGGHGKEPVELRQIAVTKTDNIYRQEIQLSDGSKTESWRIGRMQISFLPRSGEPSIFEPSQEAMKDLDPDFYTDYSKADFSGLEWISRTNYLGMQKVKGVQCLAFGASAKEETGEAMRGAASRQEDGSEEAPPVPRGGSNTAAWIDLETRLPVASRKGGKTYLFQFGAPPTAMLTLPPKIQSLLDRRAKAVEMLTRAPARRH